MVYTFLKNIILKVAKHKKLSAVFAIVLALVVYFGASQFSKTQAPTYQTAKVEKGTLITSVSESGTVAVTNKTSIITQASGVIQTVYVKNGDTVKQEQKIADVTLDYAGQQRQAQAWSSYLSAQNTLSAAQTKLHTLQSAMFKANQAFVNDKGIFNPSDTQKADPKYIQENADWLASEADYKNQASVIAQAQAAQSSSWLSYQAASQTITAPTAGVVSDMIITKGMQIGGSNTTAGSSTGISSQVVGAIKTEDGKPVVSISLSEIDAVRVREGDKATITFDAFPDKTFTGKVLGINTNGVVSSGVTTYPTTILLDEQNDSILPNMSVSAEIITSVKNNVLLVPSVAVQTLNGKTVVRVFKKGKITVVSVKIGDSSETQTEIISGVSKDDTVVTGIVAPQTNGQQSSASPFSTVRFGGIGGARSGGR